MEQYFSELVSLIKSSDTISSIDPILSSFDDQEDVNFFLSRERHCNPNFTSEQQLITRIHQYLSVLTNTIEFQTWNANIDKILKETILKQMLNDFTEVQRTIKDNLGKPKQWRAALWQKLTNDNRYNRLTVSPRLRSVERKVSPSHLRLSPEPNRAVSATRDRNRLVASESEILAILTRSSKNVGTLKNILPILDRLIFDIKHNYNIQSIIQQFNTNFQKIRTEWKDRLTPEWIVTGDSTSNLEKFLWNPLTYLASIGAYPTTTMMIHDKKTFTGQWVAGAVMAHIDIHHILHAEKHYQSGKMDSSLFFDFHLETFRQLYHLIEQLSNNTETHVNNNLKFILNMCLRLFTTHLRYLSLLTSGDWIEYPTEEEWQTWFNTLLSLTTNESENTICARQAAKAMICILEKQILSFSDRLIYMSQYILENRYPILTEEFSITLTHNTNIMAWIDYLCDEHEEKNQIWAILISLINLYDHSSRSMQQILERFQQLLFVRLINGDTSIISVFIQYLSLFFNQCMIDNNLLASFLVGLSVLNVIEDPMRFTTIYTTILPILSDFILKHIAQSEINDKPQFRFTAWLLGKISHLLITGPPKHLLEIKYAEILKSPLFSCGCETNTMNEALFQSSMASYSQLTLTDHIVETTSDDQEFLMSVYNNTDSGAQLLSKMRTFSKDKHRSLQKSIEQQANNACAHLFAVYLKHYRQVNLAIEELSRINTTKPHQKLLSLYEYANRVQMTFATTRGQGGNCEELYEQIRMRTLFLLSSIKESQWIPIIESSQQRSKNKSSRLLQQTFNVCLRFKKLMTANKKHNDQKANREEVMHRTIVSYVYGDQSRWELDELLQCMSYQHERAMLRWVTYRFIYTFLQKCIQIEENHQMMNFLTIFLLNIRGTDIEWSYLDNIPAVNSRWKEEIGKVYYSMVNFLLLTLSQNNTKPVSLVFHVLNLTYTSNDIQYLHDYEFPQRLFTLFVTSCNQSVSFESKFIAYQWFRLYVLQLWEQTTNEETIKTLSEEKWIFNELKYLFSVEQNQVSKISFQHVALGSEKHEINQYLILLLRCITVYEHIRNRCATLEYFNQLWQMYRCSTNLITTLLVLKILRQILLFLPKEQVTILMKNFLAEILSTISNSIRSKEKSSEIITELIYIYRSIISTASPWQQIATEHIFNIIISNFNSFTPNNTDQMNHLLACLSILGGYIHPFGIGSIVQIYVEDQFDQETQLGVIIEIDMNSVFPYLVQYCRTNQTRWVTVDQLRIELDVLPPNLLDLPIDHTTIGKMFDALIDFVELDDSLFDSLLILSLKRRSIGVLYRLMTSKKLLEIFMEKPYVLIIAKLSTTALSTIHCLQPTDLHLLNKRHLEQYSLSLDRCEHPKQINDELQFHVWHNSPFKEEALMMNIDYTNLDNSQWKPVGSKQFVEDFKRGRVGNEDIRIAPMMPEITTQWMLEECGTHHRFPGRMYLMNETGGTSSITFTVGDLRLTYGKWYFCIRLVESQFLQIGWATNGFNPGTTAEVSQDQYSWFYDGSPFGTDDIRWKSNDVCGCGIEIDGNNTRINYWLNGHFLGTTFAHDFPVGSTETICNMRPNGSETTYYPCVTLRVNDTSLFSTCEWIFDPEDMSECPLPIGYKPLLLPTILTVVRYPFSAYMLSTDDRDNLYRSRSASSKMFLRDFVNQHHLETEFLVDANRLILTEESHGFPFMIDHLGSWTISFDFEVLFNHSQKDICLLTLGTTSSIRIPFEKVTNNTRIAIVFCVKNQQIKTYINHEYNISKVSVIIPLTLHLLPMIAVKMRNLGFWKDALPEEQIRYLLNSGLSHINSDYHRLTTYRKLANTWTFKAKQQDFLDESLVLMNQVRCETAKDETEQSAIELYGNTTYLVLNKSTRPWSEYTLILDIQIDHLPAQNEQLTLITLNSNVSIYLTHEGHLCVTVHQTKSHSTLKLNQYVRLVITVGGSSLKLYVDGVLYLDVNINEHQLLINDDHIDLFREHNITKNDILRIKCKSITFMTNCITDINDDLESSNHSLDHLVAPPYSILAPNLILSGHDQSLIKSVLKQHPTSNIYLIDQILREQHETTIKAMQDNKPLRQNNLLTKMNPSIDKYKLKNLLQFSNFDTDEKIITLGTVLFEHWTTLQVSNPSLSSDKNWFDQAVHHLDINKQFNEWINDSSLATIQGSDLTYQLLDLNRPSSEQIQTIDHHWKKTQYSHHNIPRDQFITLRTACEHGLISIYAHYTILTMLQVWSSDGSTLFPLEKFGDYTFLLTLFRLLDYHYNNTRLHTDESIDRMSLLIKTILNVEINQLLKHQPVTDDSLSNLAPLLYQLQKNLSIQMIQLVANPSLLVDDDDKHQSTKMIQKPNLKFILKILNLFLLLLTESFARKQIDIDFLVPIVFPTILIEYLFDLFLLCPMHQTKIIILRLFIALIQTSQQLQLSKSVRNFFFHLFTQLPSDSTSISNPTLKTFQITILDLVYLLSERYKNDLIDYNFSQSFHNLLNFLDTVNALNNRTKRTTFPELFIFNGDFQFTRDELEQSQHYFDMTADFQLIDYINQHLLTNQSFTTLITSLPTDTTLNSTHYKNYPSLWHIRARCIQTRVKFFFLFSVSAEKLVSIVDLSLPIGQSFLTDKFRSARSYVLRTTKFQLLNSTLIVTELPSEDNIPSINFDTIQASTTNTKTMFYQAYVQLHPNAHILFRRQDERLWRAQYLAMHSTDAGGPYRDSITCLCADICSERLPLFILCPNGRMNDGLNRDRWIPNVFPPNNSIPNDIKKQYRFVGQLLGMAIRKKFYLDLKFPTFLWKQLVKDEVTMEDIFAIDIQSFTLINEMEKTFHSADPENDALTDILEELRFEAVSASGQTFELIPGGRNIPITLQNLKEYCSSYRQYRLQEFSRQIEYIRQGLHSVIPGFFVSLFTARELEEAVCGKGTTNIELLKCNTTYGGSFHSTSRCIQHFWTVLSTKFTEEQKKLFLKFVWGRSTLPNRHEDFTSKFIISPFTVSNGHIDGALPRAHTCSFTLDLPDYSSVDIMYDRLNYAITNCSSIDGDGNMNGMPVILDSD
ncbi:unnamed protein product [Adineta steineri]|uniref:HECT domain-containing protein n=1 Tax=Adineta steineri TaxID=433720 RepID=A0A814V4C4_9BILA|nr:unnamed protein product [Adineta steineri]CAF1183996.1 unnamed protein product [Adineta steineri]